jgi:hypothetical protein
MPANWSAAAPTNYDVPPMSLQQMADAIYALEQAFPLSAPQAGQLATDTALVASTPTTIFTVTLGVGTWKVDYGASVLLSNNAAKPTINVVLGTAAGSVNGKAATEFFPGASGDVISDSVQPLVIVTAAGTVLLQAESTNADTVKQLTAFSFPGATGWTAVRVA